MAVPLVNVTIVFAPPLKLYVTTAPEVPVIVKLAVFPEQIAVVVFILAVGKGFTVTMAVAVSVCEQLVVGLETEIKFKV